MFSETACVLQKLYRHQCVICKSTAIAANSLHRVPVLTQLKLVCEAMMTAHLMATITPPAAFRLCSPDQRLIVLFLAAWSRHSSRASYGGLGLTWALARPSHQARIGHCAGLALSISAHRTDIRRM